MKASSHRSRRRTNVLDMMRPPTNTVDTPSKTHVIIRRPSPTFLFGGRSSGAGLGGMSKFSAILNDLLQQQLPRRLPQTTTERRRYSDGMQGPHYSCISEGRNQISIAWSEQTGHSFSFYYSDLRDAHCPCSMSGDTIVEGTPWPLARSIILCACQSKKCGSQALEETPSLDRPRMESNCHVPLHPRTQTHIGEAREGATGTKGTSNAPSSALCAPRLSGFVD